MSYWIGQSFGVLSTVTNISQPLFRKKWQMLVANMAVNVFLLLNLFFSAGSVPVCFCFWWPSFKVQ